MTEPYNALELVASDFKALLNDGSWTKLIFGTPLEDDFVDRYNAMEEWVKSTDNAIQVGRVIYFKREEDLLAFKLKFGDWI